MGKVIPLSEPPMIVDVVKELEAAVIADNITEAVLIYRVKPTNDHEKGRILRYWFGENSAVVCLGLARHMCDMIADYIRDEYDILDDDEITDGN